VGKTLVEWKSTNNLHMHEYVLTVRKLSFPSQELEEGKCGGEYWLFANECIHVSIDLNYSRHVGPNKTGGLDARRAKGLHEAKNLSVERAVELEGEK
jgi:hypothetical protein